MHLDDDDIAQILKLVDRLEFDEVEIEWKGLKLRLSKRGELSPGAAGAASVAVATPAAASTAAPMAEQRAAAPAPPPAAPKAAPFDVATLAPGTTVVKAPVMGTFYRSPEPGKPPFVELGATIDAESTLGLLEVMKVYTAIRAGCAGIIERILVDDASVVEFDQPLFIVKLR